MVIHMAHERELTLLNEYIEGFNSDEFSSSDDFDRNKPSREERLARARKMKDKLGRKQKISEIFKHSLETDFAEEDDVCITQDEIDALLASVS